ncbi:MAG: hypothetical protein KDC88_09645 [Ignavibacteriae bacterium]|nr:hypothetical protein [Ignavibacteriota bacterium]MCB9260454.1 hypothetical protein [Ignavibacteriales bacterium]
MFKLNVIYSFLLFILKIFLRIKPQKSVELKNNNVLILFQHENLGVILSGKIFFENIKNSFPNSNIHLVICSKFLTNIDLSYFSNAIGLEKNDKILTLKNFRQIISRDYFSVIIPTIEKFSFFSHFILALSNSSQKIGVSYLDDEKNPFGFTFTNKIALKWKNSPDSHISEYLNEFLVKAGLKVSKIKNQILKSQQKEKLLDQYSIEKNKKIIIINNEPEELKNKWSTENLVKLISNLVSTGNYYFFYIEENIEPEIKRILESEIKVLHYINKNNFSEIYEILSISDLIITCDSTIMHLAGLFDIPQISIFGITNPFNWAPIGVNKKFLKRSDLINDITSENVYDLSLELLAKGR